MKFPEESDQFLTQDEKEFKANIEDSSEPKSRFRTRFDSPKLLVIHGLVFVCYTIVYIALLATRPPTNSNHALPLPGREVLKPELRYFPTNLEDNAFAGKPRAELDQAWHDLLRNDNIKLPKKSIEALNLTTIYTRHGDEGIASMSVYHSLHCLKKVYQMMYKGHYHIGKPETAMEREAKHADHCIEYLRESLMCRPDLSLVTFRWINDTAQHPDEPSAYFPTNVDAGLHECYNWQSLDKWAGERAFDLYRVDQLDRPRAGTRAPPEARMR